MRHWFAQVSTGSQQKPNYNDDESSDDDGGESSEEEHIVSARRSAPKRRGSSAAASRRSSAASSLNSSSMRSRGDEDEEAPDASPLYGAHDADDPAPPGTSLARVRLPPICWLRAARERQARPAVRRRRH